ncbi:MAG: hypothetical protein WBG43_05560 [Marinifilaceae bacterium]
MKVNDINDVVEGFKKEGDDVRHRYTSFDYCYNYFASHKGQALLDDMEKSCLVLGFYLASWGMLRGSSFLLDKSVMHYEDTIRYISKCDESIWNIDVDDYSDKNIDTILKVYNGVKDSLVEKGRVHRTLVTKVLLGVFGFIPAFDAYFCESFKAIYKNDPQDKELNTKCAFTVVNRDSLRCIKSFYESNKEAIDTLTDSTYTFDYGTGKKSQVKYTKAKIIDMYGFNKALLANRDKKKRAAEALKQE